MTAKFIQPQGLLTGTFWFVVKLIFWSVLGFLVAQVVSVLLLVLLGKAQAFAYTDSLLIATLGDVKAIAVNVPLYSTPMHYLLVAIHATSSTMAVWLGNVQSIHIDTGNAVINGFANAAIPTGGDYLSISLATIQLTLLRLTCVLALVPVFVWVALIAFIDGLAMRDVRTFSGGRESALLYHRARSAITPIFLGGLFLYLVLPVSLSAQLLLLPFLTGFGVAVAVATKCFKKYM